MTQLNTEIVVIGGGATGTGLARDLSMRGFKTMLVEKGDLASGTTGRFHGLLHSGGRYVVKDPQAAKECISENRILRKIMPFCIEDTGGLFVLTPWDDPKYVSKFIPGCQRAGIPCEEAELKDIFHEEPLLNNKIICAFRLPDASVDSFIAAEANAMAAEEYGAQVFTYHPVTELIRQQNRIAGVVCRNLWKDEIVEITADLVVNAAGAWVDTLLRSAGITVKMVHGKGTMLAVNHRIVNTVINRCKMPADGDIIVPAHTVAVFGTTDIPVDSPDQLAIDSWEVDLIIDEAEKVIPGVSNMRFLRAWAGVRPLYQADQTEDNRNISRAFVLLDHSERDGIDGVITITSGKWTTYRKMAEKTADLVCNKLKTNRKCRTHIEALPDPEKDHHKKKFFYLGNRLREIEKGRNYGQIICECELVSYADVANALTRRHAITLADLRRDTRLGMGPCQGCFCTLRAAGINFAVKDQSVQTANQSMLDYINERWRGVQPVLWGQQLKQEYLNLLVYKSLLQLHQLSFSNKDSVEQHNITSIDDPSGINNQIIPPDSIPEVATRPSTSSNNISTRRRLEFDVAIIGMGLSGLIAAWRLAKRGFRVGVIAKGMGSLTFHTGCFDILGYHQSNQVSSPIEAVKALTEKAPDHPYTRFQDKDFILPIEELSNLCAQAGYDLEGSIDKNWLLPTSVGASRPTCLAPSTMVAGDLHTTQPILVIGIKNYFDFYPKLIAHNIANQGIYSDFGEIELKGRWKSRLTTPRRLADLFEKGDFLKAAIGWIEEFLKDKKLSGLQRIALPAVLGLKNSQEIVHTLGASFKVPFFEIPTLPPSIPGLRIQQILSQKIRECGGTIMNGSQVVAVDQTQTKIIQIYSEAAAGHVAIQAKKYILATGGILGGGIIQHYKTPPNEVIFNLHVATRKSVAPHSSNTFLSPDVLPFMDCGIKTNSWFQPVDDRGQIVYENLHCIGKNLFGMNYIEELSSEGVDVMTGFWIGENLI
jgi:glycerol-3-phosphate dehydrogenase